MPWLKSLGLASVGVIAGVLILFFLGGQRPEYAGVYFLVALNGVILSFPISKVVMGQSPWYSPHAIVLASLFMMYVAAPAAVVYFQVKSAYFERELSPEEFGAAMLATTVGIPAYLLGFRLGPKRTTFARGIEWYFTDTPAVQRNYDLAVIGIWVIGCMAWGYTYYTTGFSESVEMIGQGRTDLKAAGGGGLIFHIAKFTYVGSLLYFSRHGLKPLSLLMMGVTAMFLLLYGSRSYLGILIIGALIVYQFRHGNVKLWVWAVMGVVLALLMGFYVLLRQTDGDVGRAVEVYSEQTADLEGKVQNLTAPWMFIVQMGEVMANMGDKIPWQYGKTLMSFFFFVPQIITTFFVDNFSTGSRVYMDYLMPHRADKLTITPSTFSEFFMNFGWLGMVIGPAFIGVIVRWLDSRMLRNPGRRFQNAWIVLSALVTVNMVRVMKNSFGSLNLGLYFLAPMILVYLPNLPLLFAPPRHSTEPEDDTVIDPDAAVGYARG